MRNHESEWRMHTFVLNFSDPYSYTKSCEFITGNHHCVSIITNYVSKSEVEYYTVPRGIETKPKLLPVLSIPLYTYIMQV